MIDPLLGPWSAGDENGAWADVWYYDDMVVPVRRGLAQSGYNDEPTDRIITYEQVMPGAYERTARLAVVDENHTDVSVCFPNMSRFCGQIFLERKDKDVALLGVRPTRLDDRRVVRD